MPWLVLLMVFVQLISEIRSILLVDRTRLLRLTFKWWVTTTSTEGTYREESCGYKPW